MGVLDKPCSAKPAQPARLHRMDTVPAYVDWRACTATPLSGVSWLKGSSKTPATGYLNEKTSVDPRRWSGLNKDDNYSNLHMIQMSQSYEVA